MPVMSTYNSLFTDLWGFVERGIYCGNEIGKLAKLGLDVAF